ncbi:glycosyltransferase [Algivirga pacifica]|uniref:Glycosyltransferase n=2 Tax=Algivirga pacifica TaxID=1162670 RepID=A0ABP9DIU2_9BACT
MIPKIIHYCWFGEQEKSNLIKECIASWKKYLKGYEFIEWTEVNSPLDIDYARQAYEAQSWAFVSDYVRCHALYNYGGIYLDTDMLLLKPFPLYNNISFFSGLETAEYVSFGAVGVMKGHPVIERLLNYYHSQSFILGQKVTIPVLLTKYLIEEECIDEQLRTLKNDILIYSQEVFYAFPSHESHEVERYKSYITTNSIAVHLWNGSWVDEFKTLREGQLWKGFKQFCKRHYQQGWQSLQYYRDTFWLLRQGLYKKIKGES